MSADISIELCGLHMRTPVIAASGTFGYGTEYERLVDVTYFGALVTKGISLEPSTGNTPPRIVETPAGMLNAVGLQNVGVRDFVTEKLPAMRSLSVPIVVNLYGKTEEEYEEISRRISDAEGVSGIEANISCPNVKRGGIAFGTDPVSAYEVIRRIRKTTHLPLIAKLSPNVTDIKVIAESVEEAGADAVSLTNTYTGMVIDVESCRPVLGNITGGLSGPAIRPVSLRLVWETVQSISIPVIGIGGIVEADDALQFLIAGATAVQIGTANFVNPKAAQHITEGMKRYMERHGIENITDVIGSIKTS